MKDKNTTRSETRDAIRSSMFLLVFGVAVLTFLVSIDRVKWFHIKPFTGAAAAMSLASAHNDGTAATRRN